MAGSEASSGNGSVVGGEDLGAKIRDRSGGQEEGIEDLLDSNKSLQEGLWATLYLLTRGRPLDSIQKVLIKTTIEAWLCFLVAFNPALQAWNIDTELWFYKYTSWLLFKIPAMQQGYATYIIIYYVLCSIILLLVVATMWLGQMLRKDDSIATQHKRVISTIQFVADIIFTLGFVACLDYLASMFNCSYMEMTAAKHYIFKDVSCLAMPHLIHTGVGVVTALVLMSVTTGLAVAACDSNPLGKSLMGSAAAVLRVKVVIFKIIFVVCGATLSNIYRGQFILMFLATLYISWMDVMQVPYRSDWPNYLWTGVWTAVTFTNGVAMGTVFSGKEWDADYRAQMTKVVLYGAFPAALFGAAMSFLRLRWLRRPLPRYKTMPEETRPKDIHKFASKEEVEVLARVMRQWDDDDVVLEEAADLGERIIKCGMVLFPNNAYMLIMYANFLIEVRKDGQGARTHLQLASKNNPSLIESYAIYACSEQLKKLKDGADGGMDMAAYLEFQRNYRAVVRAHKMALQAQRQFWQALLHETIHYSTVAQAMYEMQHAETRAFGVYRRVMSRYPSNGKLLLVYGRFLEDVKHDPWSASKYYTEAERKGTGDTMLNLTKTGKEGEGSNSLLESIDEKNDALIVINGTGVIMMINPLALATFGYQKGELEGKNVTTLMPPPFSTRHHQYLQAYHATGHGVIINQVRELVALHKDRFVFPLNLGVIKLSGSGNDTLFLGVARPVDEDKRVIKVWLTMAGNILCIEKHFEDWFGKEGLAQVGEAFASLGTDMEGLHRFVAEVAELSQTELEARKPVINTKLVHKYIEPLEVQIAAVPGGTEAQPLMVMVVRRINDTAPFMVTDQKGKIVHATSDLAKLLGYGKKQLCSMELTDLLPPPFAQLHKPWVQDMTAKVPPSSCRAGRVVQMINASGAKVAVKLAINVKEDGEALNYVVKVHKSSKEADFDDRALKLKVSQTGVVTEVVNPSAAPFFGFAPSSLEGQKLEDFISVFEAWRGANPSTPMKQLMDVLADKADTSEAGFETWRVAVKQSGLDLSSMTAAAAAKALKPAIMQIQVETDESFQEGASTTALTLWRADTLTGIVELSSTLHLHRVDQQVGFIFGLPEQSMLKHSLAKYLRLPKQPGHSVAGSTAGSTTGGGGGGGGHGLPQAQQLAALIKSGMKGAMKGGSAWHVGPLRNFEAVHADGAALKISVQAVSRDTHGKLVAKVMLLSAAKPDAKSFLRMLDTSEELELEGAGGGKAGGESMAGSESDDGRSHAEGASDAPGHVRAEQCTSGFEEHDAEPVRSSARLLADASEGPPGKAAAGPANQLARAGSGVVNDGPAMSDNGDAASADGGSSFGGDAISEKDQEVTVDHRRAKRLKKLVKLITVDIIQSAVNSFSLKSWLLLAVLLVAHIVCFVVLVQQVDSQHRYIFEVDEMGKTIDMLNVATIRSRYMYMCQVPGWSNSPACKGLLDVLRKRLLGNIQAMQMGHQGLYLGFEQLRVLKDQELYGLYTYRNTTETNYMDINPAAVKDVVKSSLWELGNRFVYAVYDVYHRCKDLGTAINTTVSYQYVTLNAPFDIFNSYLDGMDLMVLRAWNQLGGLHTVLLTLLVVEVAVVQLGVLIYQFIIVRDIRNRHTRLFTIFLALPSAVMRTMASRPCRVDDNDNDDDSASEDGDEPAAPSGPSGTSKGRPAASAPLEDSAPLIKAGKAGKQAGGVKFGIEVQAGEDMGYGEEQEQGGLYYEEAQEGEEDGYVQGYGGGYDGNYGGMQTTLLGGGPNKPAGMQSLVKRAAHKVAKRAREQQASHLGWQVNGRVLVPSLGMLVKFMTPFTMWMVALLVIYGVSYDKLSGLEGPLVSLSMAQRVVTGSSRLRLWAQALVYAETPADKALARQYLRADIVKLQADYTALMYGGISITQKGTKFEKPCPANAFASGAFSHLFYRAQGVCTRADKSTCLPKEHAYYEVATNGLDGLMQRFLSECALLASDSDSVAEPFNNTRFEFIWMVSGTDLYDGLQTAAALFAEHTIQKYQEVKQLHIILLVLTLALVGFYVMALLRPLERRVNSDAGRLAGLLANVPPEVDVESTVRNIMHGRVQEDGDEEDDD